MEYLKIYPEGISTNGRPKVYFTCHPQDFRYFSEICESIRKNHDCVICYTEDMTRPLPEEYRATDLGAMNLFVMPVTFRLLTEPSRAMDSDFAFADENNIPVLPLMMEDVSEARGASKNASETKNPILALYEQKFGKRQYLQPCSNDPTAISYCDQLDKYLSYTLFDAETSERVRKAFNAYIFLSYRKKDRVHANELMRLIHENSMYRDVAIWYDEFLTPGENFEENIADALEKCDLFTLLVTPNLVNEENYVQTHEFPMARDSGKPILPAEMVLTDRKELESKYEQIPACVDAHKKEALSAGVLDGLKQIALRPNEDDPEHNYLIGLAYLEGIDIE